MDKSHFRVGDRIYYGEDYIEITPTSPPAPQGDTMFEVTINGKVHRFEFDADTDDPADGATLVGVRYAESTDIHQLAPTRHAEPAAWDAANKHYGLFDLPAPGRDCQPAHTKQKSAQQFCCRLSARTAARKAVKGSTPFQADKRPQSR